MDREQLPRLYTDLAGWFHLLTAPEEYVDEAATYRRLFEEHVKGEFKSLLELGCGGGNNASHMKDGLDVTLTDLSPEMLEMSKRINPDCEHLIGDMRDLRLDRTFDGVLIHDAIDYLTTEADLAKAIETAAVHCRTGGVAMLVPDYVTETYADLTDHGGHDGEHRSMRYLEWTWDPDPSDNVYFMDLTMVLRDGSGDTSTVSDRHLCGLFPRATWLTLIDAAGFDPSVAEPDYDDAQGQQIFIGVKR